jgi:uncharacterized membrane protein YjjP (DUF1212 family)
MLTINGSGNLSAPFSESYTIQIAGGLNCNKLAQLDQLCYDLRKGRTDFQTADLRLHNIEESPPLYAMYYFIH